MPQERFSTSLPKGSLRFLFWLHPDIPRSLVALLNWTFPHHVCSWLIGSLFLILILQPATPLNSLILSNSISVGSLGVPNDTDIATAEREVKKDKNLFFSNNKTQFLNYLLDWPKLPEQH